MTVRSPKLVSSEDRTGARAPSASYCSTEGVAPLHTAPPVPVVLMNLASGWPFNWERAKTTHSILLFDSLWYQLMWNLEFSVSVFTCLIFSYNKECRFFTIQRHAFCGIKSLGENNRNGAGNHEQCKQEQGIKAIWKNTENEKQNDGAERK